jgi:hypothetical protein
MFIPQNNDQTITKTRKKIQRKISKLFEHWHRFDWDEERRVSSWEVSVKAEDRNGACCEIPQWRYLMLIKLWVLIFLMVLVDKKYAEVSQLTQD